MQTAFHAIWLVEKDCNAN